MTYRIGHDLLMGNTTLDRYTIIDIHNFDHFMVYSHKDHSVKDMNMNHEEVFAHFSNGIDRPETQDTEGRFTLEPNEDTPPMTKIEVGGKVKFKALHENALIEIEGFVVRNFWSNFYLVSELGVSVPNRYWKVGYDHIEQVS